MCVPRAHRDRGAQAAELILRAVPGSGWSIPSTAAAEENPAGSPRSRPRDNNLGSLQILPSMELQSHCTTTKIKALLPWLERGRVRQNDNKTQMSPGGNKPRDQGLIKGSCGKHSWIVCARDDTHGLQESKPRNSCKEGKKGFD